jgi:hypothetical protein
MLESGITSAEGQIEQLLAAVREKNEIISHLTSRLKNQEKQIEMLVSDAEEKHYHEITKHYSKTYQKYMKHNKYLLLKLDDLPGNGVYLPKCANIVHFGEI